MLADDESNPIMKQCSIHDNTASIAGLGNGGGISVSDRAYLQLSDNCTISRNAAPIGGGIFVQHVAVLIMSNATVIENQAPVGGGLFSEGVLIQISHVTFENNTSLRVGGGLAIQAVLDVSPQLLNVSICTSCTFYNNTAKFGGGMYLSLYRHNSDSSSGPNRQGLAAKLFTDDGVPFSDILFIQNEAARGGAIYMMDSKDSWPMTFQQSNFSQNIASQYGGALYLAGTYRGNANDPAPEYWMAQAMFEGNSALFGGSNVGWAVSNQHSEDAFCTDCVFGPPPSTFNGYDNVDGFATPPAAFDYITGCPSDIPLDANSFDIQLVLEDQFDTLVQGNLVESNYLNVTMTLTQGNCLFQLPDGNTTTTLNTRVNGNATVMFSGIILLGTNNATCSLVAHLLNSLYLVPDLSCDVVLKGCSSSKQVVQATGAGYDTCVQSSTNKQHIVQSLILLLVIVLLLCIICLIVLGTMYINKKRSKPFHLPTMQEFQEDTMTLKELLTNPEIPHIPLEELELGERIGMGAYGIVISGIWREQARDLAEREVALKELSLDRVTGYSSLLMEIRLMCALDDSHIVQFFGISLKSETTLYLVMELMHQGNLRDLLDKKGANLPWKMRLKFALNAAKGMDYLHEHDIIHRDLKPQNLLINNMWKCKVADFGISMITGSLAGRVIGTPNYMAPETFLEETYTAKVDVYSFGILLWELYTSARPYASYNLPKSKLLYSICHEHLRPDVSNIPSALALLICDCWHPKAKIRPSFKEIIVRLQRLHALNLPIVDSRHCESVNLYISKSVLNLQNQDGIESQSESEDNYNNCIFVNDE